MKIGNGNPPMADDKVPKIIKVYVGNSKIQDGKKIITVGLDPNTTHYGRKVIKICVDTSKTQDGKKINTVFSSNVNQVISTNSACDPQHPKEHTLALGAGEYIYCLLKCIYFIASSASLWVMSAATTTTKPFTIIILWIYMSYTR